MNNDNFSKQVLRAQAANKKIWEVIQECVKDGEADGLSFQEAAIQATLAAVSVAMGCCVMTGPDGVRLEDIVRIHSLTEQKLVEHLKEHKPIDTTATEPNKQAN